MPTPVVPSAPAPQQAVVSTGLWDDSGSELSELEDEREEGEGVEWDWTDVEEEVEEIDERDEIVRMREALEGFLEWEAVRSFFFFL